MARVSDALELNLYLDLDDEDESVTVYFHMRDQSMLVFHEVNSNPVRHNGVWTVPYTFLGRQATGLVPADGVQYFTVVDADKPALPVPLVTDRDEEDRA